MSRELVIVFLYDCDLCKSEEDDPQEAIIYFYPTWVSSEQRHALCSQLMGVLHFCNTSFSPPAVISLQSGKFALLKMGRFALSVGTDRNIPDVLLRKRLSSLHSLLRLFHCSIEAIDATLSEDDDNLTDKFSQLLQTYLPIVLDGANEFENPPLYKIPKSCNAVLDDAKEALGRFQMMNGVLGGAVLHQNKVIFTQLTPSLTKQIVLVQPHKIKLPAHYVETPFLLRNGAQLLTVFIDADDVVKLRSQLKTSRKKTNSHGDVQRGSSPSTSATSDGMMNENLVKYNGDSQPIVPDLVLDAVRARKARMANSSSLSSPAPRKPKVEKSKTTDDILATNNIPIRYFSLGLPRVNSSWTDRKTTKNRCSKNGYFNTICDPKYPLFKPDGLPASFSFYSDCTNGHGQKSVENGLEPRKELKKSEDVLFRNISEKADLSLSLSKYSDRPPPKDAPLTPLMAKLSLSVVTDDIDVDVLPSASNSKSRTTSTSDPSSCVFGLKTITGSDPTSLETSAGLVQLVLFVYAHNASSVVLLLEKSVATSRTFIQSLWEMSDTYLKSIDSELELNSEGSMLEVSSAGEYSYAVVDSDWGPAERGGFHQSSQLGMLTVLHETLNSLPHVTNLLVREEDSVTYGYRCGTSQVFYQQNCNNSLGVPTPADLMGVIPLKATSVLRRDHDVSIA
uniref:Hermansky-Pudlak syndrome 4 protein n=1 Tax=Lygus hesperus TaxID=30085 RepID=A0A146KXY7_LYGHE